MSAPVWQIESFDRPNQDGSASTGHDIALDSHLWAAMKFTTASGTALPITSFGVRIRYSGGSGQDWTITNPTATITGYIYSNSGGVPGSVVSGWGSPSISYAQVTPDFQEFRFLGSNAFSPSASSSYWLVLKASALPTGGAGRVIQFDGQLAGTGEWAHSTNSTPTWSADNSKEGWFKTYTSTKQTLAAWDIDSVAVEFNEFATSTMIVTERVDSVLTATQTFGTASRVRLWKDSTIWFFGMMVDPVFTRNPDGDFIHYVFADFWWEMEHVPYMYNHYYIAGTNTPTVVGYYATRTILFADLTGVAWSGSGPSVTGDCTAMTVKYQLSLALGYSISGGALFGYENNMTDSYCPPEAICDTSCAEVVLRCMRYFPDALCSVNYANSGHPHIDIDSADHMTERTLDLTAAPAANHLIGIPTMHPRYDLQAREAVWTADEFYKSGTDEVYVASAVQLATNPAAPLPIYLQYHMGVINPYKTVFDSTTVTPAMRALYYEGTFEFAEQDCSGTYRPGNVLTTTNGGELCTMTKNPIRRVREVIWNKGGVGSGRTTVEVGPVGRIGPSLWMDLLRMNRIRKTIPVFGAIGGISGDG